MCERLCLLWKKRTKKKFQTFIKWISNKTITLISLAHMNESKYIEPLIYRTLIIIVCRALARSSSFFFRFRWGLLRFEFFFLFHKTMRDQTNWRNIYSDIRNSVFRHEKGNETTQLFLMVKTTDIEHCYIFNCDYLCVCVCVAIIWFLLVFDVISNHWTNAQHLSKKEKIKFHFIE